jgi:3-deoxy-7-phosphoheptulonate synthase
MSVDRVNNINIVSENVLPTPAEVKERLPLPPGIEERVYDFRQQIRDILDHRDPRLLIVAGPCSIHDIGSGLEYARRLKRLSDELQDRMLFVMRVYFEKPRSSVGWKGFINDPRLDDSFRIDEGLFLARDFLLKLAAMGLPAGTEALDPVIPQYIGDLVAWTAIGARTAESQTHREMASGLSSPVGFKNGTDGNIEMAVNAIKSTLNPHHFLGITRDGRSAIFHTRGNRYAHVVLRGGLRPNYDRATVAYCEALLKLARLPRSIVIDCSHGNSEKDPTRQPAVLEDGVLQILEGNRSIVGFMLESHLRAGRQALAPTLRKPDPRVSVTDACIDWATTERILRRAHEQLKDVLAARWGRRRKKKSGR